MIAQTSSTDPSVFLPLYRWLEGASFVPHSAGGVDFWAWPINIMLAAVGWLWRIYRWLADVAASGLTSDTIADTLGSRIDSAVTRIFDPLFFFMPAAAMIILFVRFLARKAKGKEAAMELLKIGIFSVLAWTFFATGLFATVLNGAKNAVNDVAAIPAEIAARNVSNKMRENLGSLYEISEDDVLSCDKYEDVLLDIGSEAHPVQQITSAWAMWSHYPFWIAGTYGRDTGSVAMRMYCHELEALSGMPAVEQQQIAFCAAIGKQDVTSAMIDQKACDAEGRAALGMEGGELGPFRDYKFLQGNRLQTRAAAAWAICIREKTSTGGHRWKIHEGFAPLEIRYTTEDAFGERITRTGTIKEVFETNRTCENWMRGKSDINTSYAVCPPFTGDLDIEGCNVIGSATSTAALQKSPVDVPPGSDVFDTYPGKYFNWHEIANSSDVDQREAVRWIEGRGSGSPGIGEAVAAFFALIASFVYMPLGLGMAGVYVLAVYALAIFSGFAPIWMLAAVFKRGRSFAAAAAKYSAALLVMSAGVIVMLSVFTMLFGWIAAILPAESSGFVTLMVIAVTPFLTMKLINRIGRYSPSEQAYQKPLWSADAIMNVGMARKTWDTSMSRYALRAKSGGQKLYRSAKTELVKPAAKKVAKETKIAAARQVLKIAPTDRQTFMSGEYQDLDSRPGKTAVWEGVVTDMSALGKTIVFPVSGAIGLKKAGKAAWRKTKQEYGIPDKRKESAWDSLKGYSSKIVAAADAEKEAKLEKKGKKVPKKAEALRQSPTTPQTKAKLERRGKARAAAMGAYGKAMLYVKDGASKEERVQAKANMAKIEQVKENFASGTPSAYGIRLDHLQPALDKGTEKNKEVADSQRRDRMAKALQMGKKAYALQYEHIAEHIIAVGKYELIGLPEVNALLAFVRPMTEKERKAGGSKENGMVGMSKTQTRLDGKVRDSLYRLQQKNAAKLRWAALKKNREQILKAAQEMLKTAKAAQRAASAKPAPERKQTQKKEDPGREPQRRKEKKEIQPKQPQSSNQQRSVR